MDKNVRLYFVRHGETYFNKYGKMQGWSDTPLTEKGIAVAGQTGMVLKDVKFERIISSDLGRTIATANIILGASACNSDKTVEQNPAFRESFFGSFEGSDSRSTYAELAGKAGVDARDFFSLGMEGISAVMKEHDPWHEAESYDESLGRMKQGLEALVGEAGPGESNLLVVTHGNVIRTLVHDIDPAVVVTVEIHNAGVTIITYKHKQFLVESFNQI